jgi:hypothetical protein
MMPDEIGPTFVAGAKVAVVGVELDGEAVLYHEVANTIHVLSPTATIVWNLLDGESDVASIVADLAEVFQVPSEQMLEDVLTAVRAFGRQGLLEGVEADADVIAASELRAREPGARG